MRVSQSKMPWFLVGSASLAIDARTGKIYTPVESAQLTLKNVWSRLELLGPEFGKQNLKLTYDGRNDLVIENKQKSSISIVSEDSFFSSKNTKSKSNETFCGFVPGFLN